MAHSLLIRTRKDASGRLRISVGFLAHTAPQRLEPHPS